MLVLFLYVVFILLCSVFLIGVVFSLLMVILLFFYVIDIEVDMGGCFVFDYFFENVDYNLVIFILEFVLGM